jgi:GAF domain-containing protein
VWSVLSDEDRLRAVEATGLLEPGPHPAVDQIVGLTVEAVGIPYAALNMITDVAQVSVGMASLEGGVGEGQTWELSDSLCVYTVASGTSLIVDDLTDHPVLHDHSTVRAGVEAYIGIPIIDDAYQVVGTLCAWDTSPHHWTSGEVQIMTDLADVVRDLILRR